MTAEVVPIGDAGGGDDLHYEHDQSVASATWTVVHNLGKVPAVTVVDLSEVEMWGNVSYPDDNTVVITFSTALAGKAYLN